MQAGKAQASQRPTALGTMLQASTYGLAVPVVYGQTQSPLLAIWANNLRQGGSGKKGKGGGGKKGGGGSTTYVEALDFLLGHNPIMGILQLWNNGGLLPLTFTQQIFSASNGGAAAFTVTDPYFYMVVAVTATMPYSATFNDYGGAGSSSVSGSYEVPLWNQLEIGPDPTNANQHRNFPFCYRWQPSYGATVQVDALPDSNFAGISAITVYYAQLMSATSHQPPTQRMRLSFEAQMGSGAEYSGFTAQQIIYPQFAGVGSPNIDLGASGSIPAIKAELKGKWGIYSSGDCDFADIMEDIVKSGVAQAAIGATPSFTQMEHGLSAYQFPGAIQKKVASRANSNKSIAFDLPVTAGNTLLLYVDSDSTSVPTISDTLGNTWTLAAGATRTGFAYALYYCVNCLGGTDSVTFADSSAAARSLIAMELAGCDTFDSVAVVTGTQPKAQLTTTNQKGYPAAVFAFSMQGGLGSAGAPANTAGSKTLWPLIIDGVFGGSHDGTSFAQQRNVYSPAAVSLKWQGAAAANSYMVMIAFKASQANNYPSPGGDFLDRPSLDLVRRQCRANGLWGSLTMTAQQEARAWLETLYQAANAAPVFSGDKTKSIPYSEVSAAGNGAIYIAPTAAGPVANLSTDNGDFIAKPGTSPITVTRSARVDLPNVLQMQHINRNSNYHQVVTAQPEAAAIALFGVRKDSPVVNNAVQDVAVARRLLAIAGRRMLHNDRVYSFTLNAKWMGLEPMDLVTVTDALANIYKQPVRLTKMEENDQFELQCEAEPFVYGMNHPLALPATVPNPGLPNTNGDPGSINAPVFLEPVPRLINIQNQQQLWIALSGASANYGGAQLFLSTDGGASYLLCGVAEGKAITGSTTADWPAAADPDTTNDLKVDLTESLGALSSYLPADENAFKFPCLVAGGGASSIPYELATYAVATLTAAFKYTLSASGGNQLRRAVYGAPALGQGCDHPLGSRFAFLDPASTAIIKLNMDPAWIGTVLHFKACAFNTFGTNVQSLTAVTDYTFTPTGGSGSVNPNSLNYTQVPFISLSQPTGTAIALAQTTTKFPTNAVNYNARSFAITNPSTPTLYYVTIYDPSYVGDTGAALSLTAYCELTNAKVGLPGYTYLGSILAVPGGGASAVGFPGGWPIPRTFGVG